MSIILDALKKSETERQQHGQTEFSQVPIRAAAHRTPIWIWVVVALLGINLVVLLSMLLRSPPEPGNATEVGGVTETITPPGANSSAATPVTAQTPDTSGENPTVSASFAERILEVEPQPLPEPDRKTTAAPELQQVRPVTNVTEGTVSQPVARTPELADIEQLRASGEIDVGEQRVDIHVFSETPASRFVFINMTKLREGATTSDGLTVEEITPDGVILSYQGRRFFQARQ